MRTYIGEPCKKAGHTLRYTSNRMCVECSIAYAAKYAKDNPEKQKIWEWNNRTAHPEYKIVTKKWHAANPERAAKIKANWYRSNKAIQRVRGAKWIKAHPEYHCATQAKRRFTKFKATPAWLTDEDNWIMREIYELAKLRTQLTGVKHDVDHVLPLKSNTVSGLHVPLNLRVITASANRQKRNMYVD